LNNNILKVFFAVIKNMKKTRKFLAYKMIL